MLWSWPTIERGLEEDRIGTTRVGISDFAVGAVDEDIHSHRTLMRSIIGRRGMYVKWFYSNSHLMCLSNVVEMLETTTPTLRIILYSVFTQHGSIDANRLRDAAPLLSAFR